MTAEYVSCTARCPVVPIELFRLLPIEGRTARQAIGRLSRLQLTANCLAGSAYP